MQIAKVPGHKRGDLVKHFARKGFTRGAEIGVADGRFSEYMCKNMPDLELWCVDPWKPYPENKRYSGVSKRDGGKDNIKLAMQRLFPYNTHLLQMFSMEAVATLSSVKLDFVYIDANHDFDFVMQDIIEWSKLVRKGGYVAGHDYYQFRNSGVIPAVNAYAEAHNIPFVYITDEREPTWYWEKK